MQQVLDPTQGPVVDVGFRPPAPRVGTVKGAIVGLYDNGKLNAREMLDCLGELLVREHGVASIVQGSYHGGRPMMNGEWSGVERCDVVILGVGDCGSCSSSGVVNALQIEEMGVPSVFLATPPFAIVCAAMAEIGGRADFTPVLVDHPIGSASLDGLRHRAAAVVGRVIDRLLGAALPSQS